MADEHNYRDSFPVGIVPKNYSVWRDAVSGLILNFIEGAVITFMISLLFFAIPFVKPLKIALCVITFIIVTTFEFKGCHDYTLIIAYVHYLKWKKSAKKYELGTANTSTIKKHTDLKVASSIVERLKGIDWKSIVNEYQEKAKDKLGK